MTSIKNYALCLAIFLVTTLARTSLNILLQYISKGDDLSFAEVRIFDLQHLCCSLLIALFRPDILCRLRPSSVLSYIHSLCHSFSLFLTEQKRLLLLVANLLGLRNSVVFLLAGVLYISFPMTCWMPVACRCFPWIPSQ